MKRENGRKQKIEVVREEKKAVFSTRPLVNYVFVEPIESAVAYRQRDTKETLSSQ